MTRSSTRIQAKRSSNADHGDTVDEDDFVGHVSDAWSEEDATAPPRKKRKTTKLSAPKKRQGKKLVKTESFDPKWTHTRGRRGLLKQLSTEAPLDILFEVFSHLGSQDLLHLSRASKELRGLLLNRSNAGTEGLWKSAREAICELPEKPTHISEPHFIALLFDTFCMICGAPNVTSFTYMRRLCQGCLVKDLTSEHDLHEVKTSDEKSLTEIGLELHQLKCLLPTYVHRSGRYNSTFYSDDDTQLALRQYVALPVHKRAEWLIQQTAAREFKSQFTHDCKTWVNNKSTRRSIELSDLRNERYESIVERLKAVGWTEDIERMIHSDRRDFRRLKGVNKPQALTERIWANISPDILDFMKSIKDSRITRETNQNRIARCEVLIRSRRAYLCSQPTGTILPPPVDIAIMPPFARAIEQDILNTEFFKSDFDDAWKDFPSFFSEWRAVKVDKILGSDPLLQDEADLLLATKTIRGTSYCCQQTKLRFPAVLAHACRAFTHQAPDIGVPERRIMAIMQRIPTQFNTFEVCHDKEGAEIILLSRLDPDKLTYEELLRTNPLLECRACDSPRDGRLFMNYPAAIAHLSSHTRGRFDGICDMYCLTEEDLLALQITKKAPDFLPTTFEAGGFYCCHCYDEMAQYTINSHMRINHSLDEPVQDTDYVLNPERHQTWTHHEIRVPVLGPAEKDNAEVESSAMDTGGVKAG